MISQLNPGGVEAKAEALLCAGFVDVVNVDDVHVVVDCRSTTSDTTHRVRCDPNGWTCSCTAGTHHRRCSHLAAAQRITAPPGQRRLRPTTENT